MIFIKKKLAKVIKCLIVFCSILFFLLLIINFRTPFFQPQGGPWSVGFGSSNIFPDNVLDNYNLYSVEKLNALTNETNFLADPFFIKEKDTFYLFFEHQKNQSNAEIALMTSTDGVNYDFKGTVLKEKFHLSYPLVFKHKDDFFMLPETKRAGHILLYKSYNFPNDWRVFDTLVKNVKLKDPTIYLSDTLNILVASDDHMNLFMYQSDSLLGDWELHKRPKVLMGTEARPGGRFFVKDKKLHLPVQNGTFGYGYGISIYEFSFNNKNYKVNRKMPFYMKAQDTIQNFTAGMHHLDIQTIDSGFYYVFDGNQLRTNQKRLNYRGPLKWNFIDLKNWFYQKMN